MERAEVRWASSPYSQSRHRAGKTDMRFSLAAAIPTGEGDDTVYDPSSREPIDALLPDVYADLRRLAQRALHSERRDHTLQATALAHEVYLRLAREHAHPWTGRAHVLATAAHVLRRVLVDYARTRGRHKRGAGARVLPLDAARELALRADPQLVALDDALTDLAVTAPRAVQVVEMRYFGGFTSAEAAATLGVTTRTVERDWQYAKAWLFRRLSSPAEE